MPRASSEPPNDEARGRRSSRSRRRAFARKEFLRLLDDLQRKLRILEEQIEDRKETSPSTAEGRFRALVDAVPLPLAHLSSLRGDRESRDDPGEIVDFVCRYVNPAGLESIGWSDEDAPLGRRLMDDILPESEGAGRFFRECRNVVETGRPWTAEGFRCGYDRPGAGDATRSGLFDLHAGKLDDAVVLVWRRVDERREAAAGPGKRRHLDQRTLILTLAHELKTPLNALVGFCELLSSEIVGALNEPQKAHLERIRRSCRHMTSIVENAVSAWGDRRSGERLHREELDVRELLDDVTEMVRPETDRKGLEVELVVPGEPVEVRTDAGKVRQVLINLLSNAAKHTRDAVRVELDDRHEGWICFRVSDTGPGIPEEHREEIFEPFVRFGGGRDEQTRRDPGAEAGLGLAVCRRLAELLGGEVNVDSTVGEGSTFTLRIPRA